MSFKWNRWDTRNKRNNFFTELFRPKPVIQAFFKRSREQVECKILYKTKLCFGIRIRADTRLYAQTRIYIYIEILFVPFLVPPVKKGRDEIERKSD